MVYEQDPVEHTDLHNDRWIYRVSATFPSNQAIGTYRLLGCGNNGYDQRRCENHDGPTKNRTMISAIDVETMIRPKSTSTAYDRRRLLRLGDAGGIGAAASSIGTGRRVTQ